MIYSTRVYIFGDVVGLLRISVYLHTHGQMRVIVLFDRVFIRDCESNGANHLSYLHTLAKHEERGSLRAIMRLFSLTYCGALNMHSIVLSVV